MKLPFISVVVLVSFGGAILALATTPIESYYVPFPEEGHRSEVGRRQLVGCEAACSSIDVTTFTSKDDLKTAIRGFPGSEDSHGPINCWDTSQITDMSDLFRGRTGFDANIACWDTSSVTSMSYMFDRAQSFNQPIRDWDVSSVTSMFSMFSRARVFNQPIGAWDVSSVTEMFRLFYNANAFNQNLCPWGEKLQGTVSISDMFYRTSCMLNTRPDLSAVPPGPFCADCVTSAPTPMPNVQAACNICTMTHKYTFDMSDMYGFMCEDVGDTFQLDGHATTLCDSLLQGDAYPFGDPLPGGNGTGLYPNEEYCYAAMYWVMFQCTNGTLAVAGGRCTPLVTTADVITIGQVCTTVSGDNVEVDITLIGEELVLDNNCCLKETHICNYPMEMVFEIEKPNPEDCSTR